MPACLVTGAGRRGGIAAACALGLASDGWDIGLTSWRSYDREFGPPGSDDNEPAALVDELQRMGVRAIHHEADLSSAAAVPALFDHFSRLLDPFRAVVAAHCRDVELALMDVSADELDLHFAVNARSVALMVREFARRLPGDDGRFVAFTSDALRDNAPYGISKGALDRVVLVAAMELGPRGIRANCIDPGPTETGWIDAATRRTLTARAPLGRLSEPSDSANLVRFLLSPAGGWISGQILQSNGGFSVG
jgi:3-oxoacyl-[acyl-carrier protein] reductase